MSIIIRVCSPLGTDRINLDKNDSIEKLFEKVSQSVKLTPDIAWSLFKDRSKDSSKICNSSQSLSSLQLRNGDIIYLKYQQPFLNGNSENNLNDMLTNIKEDLIDQKIEQLDGRIVRQMNPQLCHHVPSGKCLHCISLEPYDENYLKQLDPPIKFLSFHSYLRKLRDNHCKNAGIFRLSDISCKIKGQCFDHAPWPEGICTKCSPNSLTLSVQKFRHVDCVQFENHIMCDRFIDYWRKTGNQRIGLLLGTHEVYENSPLGIKAKISAIFEPVQTSSRKRVELVDVEVLIDSYAERVNKGLGLECIGWIFTDLVPLDTNGKVKFFRGTAESHFLSAQECITAAFFQNKFKNPCKYSETGYYGSKFVTVVVTGDSSNNIHFESYQVSNQCMALVRDQCLVPTKDLPSFGYIKESTNAQFVPDVFYSKKDKYGNEITKLGRPLPVEFLLVDMATSFPTTVDNRLMNQRNCNFPIENRTDCDENHDFSQFGRHLNSAISSNELLQILSNYHILYYLVKSADFFALESHIDNIIQSVRDNDVKSLSTIYNSDEWRNVISLMQHAEVSYEDAVGWTCSRCTLLNSSDKTICAVCGSEKI